MSSCLLVEVELMTIYTFGLSISPVHLQQCILFYLLIICCRCKSVIFKVNSLQNFRLRTKMKHFYSKFDSTTAINDSDTSLRGYSMFRNVFTTKVEKVTSSVNSSQAKCFLSLLEVVDLL